MFEFDAEKSAANLAKHGIDFETAQALWQDLNRTEIDVVRNDELRTLAIGLIDGQLWTVVYTLRGEIVRIISARRAWDKEIRRYGH